MAVSVRPKNAHRKYWKFCIEGLRESTVTSREDFSAIPPAPPNTLPRKYLRPPLPVQRLTHAAILDCRRERLGSVGRLHHCPSSWHTSRREISSPAPTHRRGRSGIPLSSGAPSIPPELDSRREILGSVRLRRLHHSPARGTRRAAKYRHLLPHIALAGAASHFSPARIHIAGTRRSPRDTRECQAQSPASLPQLVAHVTPLRRVPLFVAIHALLHLRRAKHRHLFLLPHIAMAGAAFHFRRRMPRVAEKHEVRQFVDPPRRNSRAVLLVADLALRHRRKARRLFPLRPGVALLARHLQRRVPLVRKRPVTRRQCQGNE